MLLKCCNVSNINYLDTKLPIKHFRMQKKRRPKWEWVKDPELTQKR